jgi:hypothetical protein
VGLNAPTALMCAFERISFNPKSGSVLVVHVHMMSARFNSGIIAFLDGFRN